MSLVEPLELAAVRPLTPHMLRCTFTGPGLSDLDTWPDQQLKLLFPRHGQARPVLPDRDPDDLMGWYQEFLAIPDAERPSMRSFTVRHLDTARGTMDIDFVLHGDDGPATAWAGAARPGAALARYGPSADYFRPLGAAEWYLFAGDETALPAVGTLLESLPAGGKAVAYLEVRNAAERQEFASAAAVTVRWLHRDEGGDLVSAVRAAEFPPGAGFAWLAGEAGAVRTLRRHLVGERGMTKDRIEFSGYWRRALTQDDAPTAEDLADAREKVG